MPDETKREGIIATNWRREKAMDGVMLVRQFRWLLKMMICQLQHLNLQV